MWTKWLGALLLASSALAARAQPAPPPAPADVLAIPAALKQQFREQVIEHTRLPHARVIGMPASACSRMATSSGSEPSNGTL